MMSDLRIAMAAAAAFATIPGIGNAAATPSGGARAFHARADVVVATGHRGHETRVKQHARRHVEVDAPTTSVSSRRGDVVVDAPYTFVERSHRGVRVRAPFVDIYVPRR